MYLFPLVLDPKFIIKICKDEENREKFKSFLIQYKDFLTEIFILISDDEENIMKEYNDLRKNSEFNPSIKIILEHFLTLRNNNKFVKIKIDKKENIANGIIDKLKKNNVKNIVHFPNIFNENFIKLKKVSAKIKHPDSNYQTAIEMISSITRFSKKICLIDPMIPYELTTLNYVTRQIKHKGIQDVKLNTHQKANYYKLGLKKIIETIYNNNFFKDELQIHICTTINNAKITQIREKIKDEIYRKKITEEDLNAWKNLDKTVIEVIKKQTSNIINNLEPSVEIKQHFFNKEKILNEFKKDLYDRHIYAEDIHAQLEVRKGFDLFENENELRKESNYSLRMVIDDNEKNHVISIFSHPKYQPCSKETLLNEVTSRTNKSKKSELQQAKRDRENYRKSY